MVESAAHLVDNMVPFRSEKTVDNDHADRNGL